MSEQPDAGQPDAGQPDAGHLGVEALADLLAGEGDASAPRTCPAAPAAPRR